jgi:hypothetical protein
MALFNLNTSGKYLSKMYDKFQNLANIDPHRLSDEELTWCEQTNSSGQLNPDLYRAPIVAEGARYQKGMVDDYRKFKHGDRTWVDNK